MELRLVRGVQCSQPKLEPLILELEAPRVGKYEEGKKKRGRTRASKDLYRHSGGPCGWLIRDQTAVALEVTAAST